MGSIKINGWENLNYSTVVLTGGSADNIPMATEYLVLVPVEILNRVVSFGTDNFDTAANWLMEVANGDPTGLLSIKFVGGAPAQSPPQIVLPAGFTSLTLPPGYAQRIIYVMGVGWCPLTSGTLVQ